MKRRILTKIKSIYRGTHFWFFTFLLLVLFLFFGIPEIFSSKVSNNIKNIIIRKEEKKETNSTILPLDKDAYDKKMLELANNPPDPIIYKTVKTEIGKDKNGKPIYKTEKVPLDPQPIKTHLWPVKAVYPNAGAILPLNRIVAFYGNLYSKNMGILGQYEEDEMLKRLQDEIGKWEIADPETPVIPALHYIAVVAQGSAGKDGKYRTRMPNTEIDKVLKIAEKIPVRPGSGNAVVFLDIQVALSNLQAEIPAFEKYFKMPNVHLGIDPEFSMKTGKKPGTVIGTFDASDINFAIQYLSKIVKTNNLPPKVLVVHRFTQSMITNYKEIKPTEEVQIVMDMDGWGEKMKKIGTYKQFIYKEPVQFTGFKLFFKNDLFTPGSVMFTPTELLKLNPRPSYIQYQ